MRVDKPKVSYSTHIILAVVAAITITAGLLCIGTRRFVEEWMTEVNWRPIKYEREIGSMSAQFEELWSMSSVYVGMTDSSGSVYLSASANDLFLLASLDPNKRESINTLDFDTGEVKWQISLDTIGIFTPPTTIASNTQFVYLGLAGGGKVQGEMTTGAGKIIAYDKVTGKEIWSQVIGGARGLYSVNVTESAVSVNGSTSSHFYLLDATTGRVLEKRSKEEPTSYPLFIEGNIEFADDGCAAIHASDLDKGSTIWRAPYERCLSKPVMFTDRVLILSPGQIGYVQALERTTGNVLWRYDEFPVVSNLTLGDGPDGPIVYFLTSEAELIAVDAYTGESLGSVQFVIENNAPTDLPPYTKVNYTADVFSVAASGDTIAVLLGDSGQLFTSRFSPENLND